MPGLDGFEATGELRRREAGTGRYTPVVAMTAHAADEDRARCLAAGMDAYVSKPLDIERLTEAIGVALAAGARHEATPSAPQPQWRQSPTSPSVPAPHKLA